LPKIGWPSFRDPDGAQLAARSPSEESRGLAVIRRENGGESWTHIVQQDAVICDFSIAVMLQFPFRESAGRAAAALREGLGRQQCCNCFGPPFSSPELRALCNKALATGRRHKFPESRALRQDKAFLATTLRRWIDGTTGVQILAAMRLLRCRANQNFTLL